MTRTEPILMRKTMPLSKKEHAGIAGAGAAEGTEAGAPPKKPHRFRKGTVALREIRKAQKSADLVITRAPYQRQIREIAREINPFVRFSEQTLDVLYHITQKKVVELLEESQSLAHHAKRTRVMDRDVKYAAERLSEQWW